MKVLLEEGVFKNTQMKILHTLAQMHIGHTLWDYKSYPPYDGKDKEVFFIGSNLTARNLKHAGYKYYIDIDKKFDYSYWTSYIDEIFNVEYVISTLGRIKNEELDYDELFTRTNTHTDIFVGKIRNRSETEQEYTTSGLLPETQIILTPVLSIHKTAKYIVHNNKVICTQNQYTKKLEHILTNTFLYNAPKLFICEIHIDEDDAISIVDISSPNTTNLHDLNLEVFFKAVLQLNEA